MTKSDLSNRISTPEEEDAFLHGMALEAMKNGVDVGYAQANRPKERKTEQEQEGPIFDYQMKRFVAVVAVLVAGYCFCAAAENGALDGVMKLLGYVISGIAIISFVHGALQND